VSSDGRNSSAIRFVARARAPLARSPIYPPIPAHLSWSTQAYNVIGPIASSSRTSRPPCRASLTSSIVSVRDRYLAGSIYIGLRDRVLMRTGLVARRHIDQGQVGQAERSHGSRRAATRAPRGDHQGVAGARDQGRARDRGRPR